MDVPRLVNSLGVLEDDTKFESDKFEEYLLVRLYLVLCRCVFTGPVVLTEGEGENTNTNFHIFVIHEQN